MLFAKVAHAASSRQSRRGFGQRNDESSDSLRERCLTISLSVGTRYSTSLHFHAGSVIIVLYEQTTPCSSFVNLTDSEMPSSAVLSNSSALARTSVGWADWQSHPCAISFVSRAPFPLHEESPSFTQPASLPRISFEPLCPQPMAFSIFLSTDPNALYAAYTHGGGHVVSESPASTLTGIFTRGAKCAASKYGAIASAADFAAGVFCLSTRSGHPL